MCTQKPPHDYSQQLYEKYKESCDSYIVEKAGAIFSPCPRLDFCTFSLGTLQHVSATVLLQTGFHCGAI